MREEMPNVRDTNPGWEACCSEFLPAMLWRQRLLADILGDRPWSFSMDQGAIAFGDDLAFGMQLIGSESDNGTFLWAWGNEASKLPPELTALSASLRSFGEEQDVPVFRERMLAIEEGEAFLLALIASGVAGGLPVYRAPYPGGAMYIAVDTKLPQQSPDAPAAVSLLGESIQYDLPLDHRRMVTSFGDRTGVAYDETPGSVVLHFAGGDIAVDFDELGRMSRMSGNISQGTDDDEA